MIINDQYRFIFQHNPKCAGTFLHHFLNNYVDGSVGERNLLEIFDNPDDVKAHITFDRIVDERYRNYNLLMGVRNPIDMYVSLYCDMNFPREVFNHYKTSSAKGFRSINFYDEDQASNKANKEYGFETFMERRTKEFKKEESISYKFLEKNQDYDNLFVYKKETILQDIESFFSVNDIPFNKRVFEGTIIRMSNKKRAEEIKSSLSEGFKTKIMKYEYIISGYYK